MATSGKIPHLNEFDSRRIHQYLFLYQLFTSILDGSLPASLNLFEISSFC